MRPFVLTLLFFGGAVSFALAQHPELEAALDLAASHDYSASNTALRTFIEVHPQRKYDVAQAWWAISGNLLALGQSQEAIKANETSLAIRQRLRSGGMALNFLRASEIHLAAGEGGEALYAAQEGMQMFIEDSRVFAELNLAAARALQQLKQTQEAQAFLKTALDIAAIEFGTDSSAYGEVSFAAAKIQQDQRKYYSAFQSYAKAYYRMAEPVQRVRALVRAYEIYGWQ